jgi:hypothetical protein
MTVSGCCQTDAGFDAIISGTRQWPTCQMHAAMRKMPLNGFRRAVFSVDVPV